jgi:polar amino acid transport system substrate-binding protein
MNTKGLFIGLCVLGMLLASWYVMRRCICAGNVPDQEGAALIVGTNAEYPPFTFIQDGNIVGFDIDLINEVAKRLGKQIEFRDMPFTTLLPQLQLGTIQVIAAGMSPTPERAKQVLFTKPHLTGSKLVMITRKPLLAPTTVADLQGKDVVVNEGFVTDLYLADRGIVTRKLPAVADAFLALRSGRADVFVTAENTVKPFFEHYSADEFNVNSLPDVQESTAFAVSKEYPALQEHMNQMLDQISDDGTLLTLKRKWGLDQ